METARFAGRIAARCIVAQTAHAGTHHHAALPILQAGTADAACRQTAGRQAGPLASQIPPPLLSVILTVMEVRPCNLESESRLHWPLSADFYFARERRWDVSGTDGDLSRHRKPSSG